MTWLHRYSIRHPRLVVSVAVVLTLAIAPGVMRLKLRTDGHALVPPDAPEVVYDDSVRERFGTQDLIVVLVEANHADGVFNTRTLRLIEALTTAFQQIGAFAIPPELAGDLEAGTVSPALREAFALHDANLSPSASVVPRERLRQWQIEDRGRWCTIDRPQPQDPTLAVPLNVSRQNVLSLATERADRVVPGTLRFRRFLDPFPETDQDLQRLRDDLRAIGLYTGTLISSDERSAAIFVGVPRDADRTGLYRQVRDIVRSRPDVPERIQVVGAPVAEGLLGTHILEDLGVPAAVLGHRLDRGDEAPDHASAFYTLRLFIARHIGLLPIAMAVMGLVFVITFRSVTAALLPLTEVGACLLMVFGLMGWLGVPVYLTIAVLPVILTAVAVADEVHVFHHYVQQLRDRSGHDHVELVMATMDELWLPVTKASVTTAVGFLSFAVSPMKPVQAFGLFTALGVVLCMVWSLTVIPALLVLARPAWFLAGRPRVDAGRPPAGRGWFERFCMGVVRWRYVVLVAAIVLVAASPLGVRRLVIQDSWIDGFAPDSAFYRATRRFNDQFLGTHILGVSVDTGSQVLKGALAAEHFGDHEISLPGDIVADPQVLVGQHIELWRELGPAVASGPAGRGPEQRSWQSPIEAAVRQGERITVTTPRQKGLARYALRLNDGGTAKYEIKPKRLTSPEVLERIDRLEAFIRAKTDCAVGGVLGPAAYIKTTNFLTRARNELFRRIPEDAIGVEQAWSRYRMVRGPQRLREVVDQDYAQGLLTVYLRNANFVDTARLMADIRDYEREHLQPAGISVGFAGDVAVSQTLVSGIVTTQTRSLVISLVGDLLVIALLGWSLQWGLYCVVPCVLAVLFNFAVMGLLGMPLGVATSMFAAMTLGVGVDYAIHLVEPYRLAHARGMTVEAALAEAVRMTGPALAIDALAVGLGFGVLVLSQVPANARLGALLGLCIAGCLLATFLLLPALIRIWPPDKKISQRLATDPTTSASVK